jgi:hypothetical protein
MDATLTLVDLGAAIANCSVIRPKLQVSVLLLASRPATTLRALALTAAPPPAGRRGAA